MSDDRRDTVAEGPRLLTDPTEIAEAESRNGLLQTDRAIAVANEGIERDGWKLRPSMLLALQGIALQGLTSYAGTYRVGPVAIHKSGHTPPDAHLVPELVEDMCDYVNSAFTSATAIHLASYVMWRLNWIHPFSDGNGRTSRAASFIVLSVRAEFIPPGRLTVPQQIVDNRLPYFAALEAADAAWKEGKIDVSAMEALWGALLAKQLMSFFESAGGILPEVVSVDGGTY